MNKVFERNISVLEKRNPELAEKLDSYTVVEIPQLKSENGFYNLYYKKVPLHNPLNPLGEAQEIFARTENTPVTIHLIYGVGLGYLFQVSTKLSAGTVILYEPDLNILKIAFTLVDFTEDIIKDNVYITDSIEQVKEIIYRKSNTKNLPLLLSTTAYRELDKNSFNNIVDMLQRTIGSYILDLKYTQQRFYSLVLNIVQNIPHLADEIPLDCLRDIYKGKTAVVVSAGPTLDRNIETIKKYRDNIVLIVVGTAMKTLARHNLKPDFLCIIEAYDTSKQISDIDLSNVNLVTEPYSNPNIRKYKFKQVYLHTSKNLPVNNFWRNISGQNTNEYLSKGTVSYTALNTARLLGCKKIVLAGQDLAYIEGQCYSKDSAYKDLECRFNKENNRWEITAKNFDEFTNSLSNSPDKDTRIKVAENRLANLNNSLYYVKGIRGDEIPTESVYAAFIKPLTEYTEMFPDREYINTSLVGAQIDGFKNISMEEALQDTEPVGAQNFRIDYKLDIEFLRQNLKNEVLNLENAKDSVLNGKNLIRKMNNNLQRSGSVTVDMLKDLKKITKQFLDISNVEKDNLYDFITIAEKINVDYAMKMTVDFNLQAVKKLIGKYAGYFNSAEDRINSVVELLQNTLENL